MQTTFSSSSSFSSSSFPVPPEILIHIGHYLTQHDLAQCVRVSQEWLSCLTPCLWRDMIVHNDSTQSSDNNVNSRGRSISDSNNDNILNKERNSPEFISALVRNKQYIRHISTTDPAVLFLLMLTRPPIEGLESLDLCLNHEIPTDSPIWSAKEMEASVAMLEKFDTLMQAGVEHPGGRYQPNHWAMLVFLLQHNNSTLRALTMNEGCFWDDLDGDAFLLVMREFPTASLERLEISFDGRRRRQGRHDGDGGEGLPLRRIPEDGLLYFGEEFQEYKDKDKECFDRLTEVIIRSNDTVDSEVEVQRLVFLIWCSELRKLTLDGLLNWNVADLMMMASIAWRQLDQLILTNIADMTDEIWEYVLNASRPGWIVLKFTDMVGFGEKAFGALKRSMSRLTWINVGCWKGFGQDMALDLLCSAKELRWLFGPEVEGSDSPNKVCEPLRIHAIEAYREHFGHRVKQKDRTWALGPKMEILQMHIDGVPRPDVFCDLKGKRLETFSKDIDSRECLYKVQRWIYEQLGRMTNLQDLILGSIEFDKSYSEGEQGRRPKRRRPRSGFQLYCLEFSLASGLELLAGMKELQTLDVWATAHRIGVKELDWMHTNWPKLQTIVGWNSDREWTGDEEGNLAWKVAVDEWMAAHPHGIGSSFYEKVI